MGRTGVRRAAQAGSPLIETADLDQGAVGFLGRVLGTPFRASRIAGDASSKRFYRIRVGRPGGSGAVSRGGKGSRRPPAPPKTTILMINPEPLDPSSPLLTNHRILEAIGAPVPRILALDARPGLVLTEDLGDTTLQLHLLGEERRRARESRRLYRQACDLIVLLQTEAARVIRPDDFAARNALDRERFLFELEHFHRHYILGLKGMTPEPPEDALLKAFYADLAESCDRMPRVYCHRDFMSRNLMVAGTRLGLIDYQDARMGPYAYDAASLLRDSSLDLDEDLVGEMIDYLARRLGVGPEELRRDFDTMALERNLKELGTFGFMVTERQLRIYLDYVPRAIASARRTLLSDRRYHFVFPVLDRYLIP